MSAVLAWSGLVLMAINAVAQMYLDVLTRNMHKKLSDQREVNYKRLKAIYENRAKFSPREIRKLQWWEKVVQVTLLVLFVDFSWWMILNYN